MRPVESRPMCCQLRPASVERYTPLPSVVSERMKKVSPVPAHSTLCAEGASASAPIDCAGWLSNTARQCTPSSSVFQTPPDAAPLYATSGLPGSPTAAMARLPVGPTKRKCRRAHRVVSSPGGAGACCPVAPSSGVSETSSASLSARDEQTAFEAGIDLLVGLVGLRVRSCRRPAGQRTPRRGLNVRECAGADSREQRGAVRAAFFPIDGGDRQSKDVGLQLANEGALRAASGQQQLLRHEAELAQNLERVLERETDTFEHRSRHVSARMREA